MNDKDIFYSMVERKIDNFLMVNPSLGFLSGPIKKWIITFIDPYVSLFFNGEVIQTEMASSFLKQEFSDKVEKFKKEFEAKKNEKSK